MTDKLISDLVAGIAAANTEVEILLNAASTSTKESIGDILDIINGDVNVDSAGASTYNADSIVNADINTAAAIELSKLAAITYTDTVPCTLEVSEGTVALPDIHTLATAGAKVDGFVLPDGASTSTINFKCVIPRNLAATPAMLIRVRFMTQAADTDHAVRLTVSTIGIAVNEVLDQALTAETEVTAECANTTETMNEAVIEIDLTTDWAADDTVIGQLTRDPTDAVDDFAGNILVVGIELLVDRTIS